MDAKSPNTSSPPPNIKNATVPPVHPCRTLVLCFDGTGHQIDKNNTNATHFFSMLSKVDRSRQMVFYQTGIGTYTTKDIVGSASSTIVQTLDTLFPGSMNDHLKDAYEFLMQNYEAGDKICVFGFSRGAYTARALVGMLQKVGLLPPSNIRHIDFAYKAFLQGGPAGEKQACDFKENFSITVNIEFVGIWDAVGPWGVLGANLPLELSNSTIKTVRHALSLDERRTLFQANLWVPSSYRVVQPEPKVRPTNRDEKGSEKDDHTQQSSKTDIQEVWFAGSHSDVGGGSLGTYDPHTGTLSRVSLRWMVRECFRAQTGIMFSADFLRDLGMDIDRLYPEVMPRSVEEDEHELKDALSPIHDQLNLAYGWWLLEVLPLRRWHITGDGRRARRTTVNLGKPRIIPQQSKGIMLHRSVKMRMQADIGYKPKPRLEVEPIWVD